MHGSVVHELVRRSGNISVHVIAGDALTAEPIPKKTVRTAEGAQALDPRPYLVALIAVAIALGVGQLIRPVLGIENIDLVDKVIIKASGLTIGAPKPIESAPSRPLAESEESTTDEASRRENDRLAKEKQSCCMRRAA